MDIFPSSQPQKEDYLSAYNYLFLRIEYLHNDI